MENEVVDLKLSVHLLKLMLNESIDFEKKKGKMDYLIRMGADVNKEVYGKSMALWAKELNDEKIVEYIKEKGGVESQISKKEAKKLGRQFWDKRGGEKSVNEIKELLVKGANLSVKNNKNRQIWPYLSIEEINEILKDLPKGYVIDGDVDLSGGMNLYKIIFRELPDFSKIKVGGSFDCSSGYLETLKGAPMEVKGNFDCGYNNLVSLVGVPREVGGDFSCKENKLTTLEGAPEKIEGFFDCHANKLITLEGGPSKVGESFYCGGNQLTTLKGTPEEVRGNFMCPYNQLTSLEGAPQKVGGNFDCSYNQLITLDGVPSEVGKDFDCGHNRLTTLNGMPKKVSGTFLCWCNKLTSLEGAPNEVGGDFHCCNNKLITLKGKPEKIGGKFEIDEDVLARIEEAEKMKKNDNTVIGFVGRKFEM